MVCTLTVVAKQMKDMTLHEVQILQNYTSKHTRTFWNGFKKTFEVQKQMKE